MLSKTVGIFLSTYARNLTVTSFYYAEEAARFAHKSMTESIGKPRLLDILCFLHNETGHKLERQYEVFEIT